MRQTLWNLAKFAIGLGLLYFLFTRLEDPAALWQQIVTADKWLLLLGAGCYATAVALSGIKWGVLLAASGIQVRLRRLMSYQWLAEFFNNFLPAQVGGDVMRGYALASDTHRRATAAASVLIDRFIGLMIFMMAAALGAGGMLIWGRPDGTPFTAQELLTVRFIALGSGVASLLLVGLVASLLSRRLKRLAEAILNRLPFTHVTVPIWQKLAEAFNVYRDQYRALLLCALGSTLIVILTSVNIWLIAYAIQPNSITLAEVLTINPIIVFVALVIPLSPGGLGVRQGAFAATFALMGAGGELGLAVGLLQQLIGYLVSLPGAYLWVRGSKRTPAVPQTHPYPSDTPNSSHI